MSELDRVGCLGNTIKVAAGHYVDLANPHPMSIDLPTIASALSKLCRFGCHCPTFYSVAEHCVHATRLAAADNLCREGLRAVLLHDAAEAYVGDVVKPLKVMLPDYAKVEARMEAAVSERFGVDFKRWSTEIKRYDRMMLKAEKIALWPEDTEEWTGFAEIEDCEVELGLWSPHDAEWKFLFNAEVLGLIT